MYVRMRKKITTRTVKPSPVGPPRRSHRLNIRASAEQETLIRAAAQRRGENLTDFVLRSACVEAEFTLVDKHSFALPPERWNEFLNALDRPPVLKPQLQRLVSEESILEKPR